MDDELELATVAPLIKLTNAFLLVFDKKGATKARFYRDGDVFAVDFLVDDVLVREAEPPLATHPPVIRRLAMMASLPTYKKGEAAEGQIVILVGGNRRIAFDLRVSGHGPELEAWLRKSVS